MNIKKLIVFFSLSLLLSCSKDSTPPIAPPQNQATPEMPETTLGFMAITMPNDLQTVVYYLDTTQIIHVWKNIQSDFFDAQLDWHYQQLYFFPKSRGEMQAIDTKTKEVCWTLPLTTSALPQWFRGVELIDKLLYVSDYYSYVNVYDYRKGIVKNFHLSEDYMATHFLHHNDIVYTFQQPKNNSRHKRIICYNFGMVIVCNVIFNEELIDWFVRDESESVLFHNHESGFGITSLFYATNGTTQIKTVSEEKIVDVCKVEKDQYIIASNQKLYHYNHADRSLISFTNMEDIAQIEWNSLTSQLAISSEKEILLYSTSQREIVWRYTFPYKVKKFFWHLQ